MIARVMISGTKSTRRLIVMVFATFTDLRRLNRMNEDKNIDIKGLNFENNPVLGTLMSENDPIIEIAKSLKSIDRTLKHIEEDMRKRKV